MAWYNVLGNENAAWVASTKNEAWANTVTNVKRNSCSNTVCSFEAGGSKYYANDALITKRGDIVSFHPDDNILAFKGRGPKGNQQITNNFYIYEAGDPDRIAEEIMKKITRVSRIGF
jgi:hypothetical protein